MADLQISQLPTLSSVAAVDELPIVDVSGSETRKTTAKDLVQQGVALIDAGSIPGSALASLGANSVVTASITDGNVTNAKLQNSSFSLGGLSISLGSSDPTPSFDLTDATNYPASSLTGTITNAQLAGSIANNKLANSSISLAGVSINLGDTNATPTFDLTNATNYPASSLTGTVSNAQLAGSIDNNKLVNSAISLGGVSISLGGSNSSPSFDLSSATNYPTSALSGTITNAQLAGSIQGSKLVGGSVTATELGTNSVTAVQLADLSVDTAALINSSVTNDKISAVSGTKITANSIPASALSTSNIDRSLDVSNGSLGIANIVIAGQSLGISYNAQGLITAAVGLSSSDLPISDASNLGGVSVPSGSGLSVTGAGALSLSNSVTATTVSGIEIDSHGSVVSITSLTGTDLPTSTTSSKGAVIVQSGGGLQIDGSGNLSTALSGIAAGTYQSVTVSTKGIVTAGQSLISSDIPNISATKLTSGTIDIGRFATNSITGQKLADSSVCQFTGATSTSGVVTFPTAEYKGQFFYDLTNDDLYVYDGSAFQPVTITSGEIIYAGNYRADTNKITSLSAAGTAQGFTLDGALVAASSANNRYYFVCDKSGTGTSPAPTVTINPPDMILSNGNTWEKLDISNFIAGQSASNISVSPSGGIQNTNVQSVLEELDNEKLNLTGGTMTGVLNINENSSIVFEGATPDDFETTLTIIDATQDNTLSLPNVTGTLVSTGDTGSVTSTMLADGTITNTDINASAAISISKLEALSSAQIIIGNSSNQPTAVGITGDISIDDAGLVSISSGVLVDSDISATAAITGTKIQAGNTSGTVGVLALTDSASSSSTTTAATPASVKTVNDALTTTTATANAAVEKAGDTMSGNLILGNAKQVRFSELTSSGANYVSLQAPDTLAADTSYTLPSALPTAEGQILASTTGGVLSWVSDPAGQWVTSGDNISYSAGDVSFIGASANLKWDKSTDDLIFDDGVKALFGTSSDGLAIYHNGSNSVIGDIGTGNLVLQTNGTGIYFQASGENLATFTKDGACALFFDNDRKIRTTGTGAVVESTTGHTYFQVLAEEDVNTANAIIRITPTNTSAAGSIQFGAVGATSAGKILYSNNTNQFEFNTNNLLALTLDSSQKAIFAGDTSLGDSGTAYFGSDNDLWMMHNGSTGYINNSTGDLYIRDTDGDIYIQAKAGENSIVAHNDAACELYYDGGTTPTFETKATGAVINGTLNTGGLSVGSGTSSSSHMHIGASATGDNYAYIDLVGDTTYTDYGARLIRGSGGANTTTSLVHRGTGQLQITAADAGSISLNTSNTAALTIASNHDATFTGDVDLADNKKIKLGTSDDLQIYHNSLRNLIECHNSRELHINKDTSESLAKFIPDGAVQLFYDNNKKFQTLSNGCQVSNSIGDVYFEVKASENVNTADSIIRAAVANTSAHSIIQFGDSDNWSKSSIDYDHASDEMHFKIDATERFKVNASGIQVTGSALGQNSGDEITFASFKSSNGNVNYLDVKQIRDSAGTNWTTATTRIQQSTDSTDQGYIEFNGTNNSTGVIVGTGSGSQDDISIKCVRNDRVELYYDGGTTPKLQTETQGIKVQNSNWATVDIVAGGNDATLRLENEAGPAHDWTMRNDFSEGNDLDFRYNNARKMNLDSDGNLWIQGSFDVGDNDKLLLGNGDDMQIYHDITSNRNRIDNFGRDFYLINKNTDGSVFEEQLKAEPNGAVTLYWDGAPKFNTTSIGANLEGNLTLSAEINLVGGSDAARFIDAQLGDNNELHFRRVSGGDLAHENMAKFTGGGGCKLFYDASTNPRLETTSAGIKVTGSNGISPTLNLLSSNADVEGTSIRFGRTDNGNIRYHSLMQMNGGAAANNYLDFKLHNGGSGGSYTEQISVLKLTGQGKVFIPNSLLVGTTTFGAVATIWNTDQTTQALLSLKDTGSGAGNHSQIEFNTVNGFAGNIVSNNLSVAYNTSSDYRLKENEVAISDGITRLKTLKPYRFNFKNDSSKTVDGFFAHEVTPAVPEAITGEKDGTEMQGIDQSKLVPLLTAALQEAITKIETLETKVAALEAG